MAQNQPPGPSRPITGRQLNYIIIRSSMQSLQEFLTEGQREALSRSLLNVKGKLKKLPTRFGLILAACQEEDLRYLEDIDPEGQMLLERVCKLNLDALYAQFQEVGEAVCKLVIENRGRYEREHSLIFLRGQISEIVNQTCSSSSFSLRLQQSMSMGGSSLWERLHVQLMETAMGITGFMHNHYDMTLSEDRRELEINCFSESFRQKFEDRGRLNKLYGLNQRLDKEMLEFRNESVIVDYTEEDDEWVRIMEQIEELEKGDEEAVKLQEEFAKQQNRRQQQENNHKQQGKNNIFGGLKNTLQKSFQNVKAIITKSSAYEQKAINAIDLQENLQSYLQNLEAHSEVPLPIKREMEGMALLPLLQIQQILQQQFDERELSIIQFAITTSINKWNDHQRSFAAESPLYTNSICILSGYSAKLHSALEKLKPGNKSTELGQYLLAGYFYRALQQQYCPFAKRYLMKVLKIIEVELQRKNKAYLRGVLRIFQAASIQPTKIATLLSNQRPSRSKEFQQSHQSKLFMDNNVFEDQALLIQETEDCLFQIKKEQGMKEPIPQIAFSRLSISPPTKTVTIVISGFLSEDSAKDLEWMGLIRALQNSELYSLSWKSSTLKETGLYVADLAKDLVFNPLSLSGNAGIAVNLLRIGARVAKEYKGNPFAVAHARAIAVGTYLAQFICKVFPDRFVNLVGFSLGTEVVSHCLSRLTQRGQLGLVNKIVMLGSAANREEVKSLLERAPLSLEMLNMWSEGDYSIKYIYRLCRLGSVALGSADLSPIGGHEISNINCSKFVKSHMDFRCNLYGIGLLSGLIHD